MEKREYFLQVDKSKHLASYQDDYLQVEIDYSSHSIMNHEIIQEPIPPDYRFDMSIYHTLRILMDSILDTKRVNYINMVYL